MSDSESSPSVGNVEGDVNVGAPAEEAPESTEESTPEGDGDTADDGSQQDTGELQE